MSKTGNSSRELQDSELELVSGGAPADELSAISQSLSMIIQGFNEVVKSIHDYAGNAFHKA